MALLHLCLVVQVGRVADRGLAFLLAWHRVLSAVGGSGYHEVVVKDAYRVVMGIVYLHLVLLMLLRVEPLLLLLLVVVSRTLCRHLVGVALGRHTVISSGTVAVIGFVAS